MRLALQQKATAITTCFGTISDMVGRRPMLILSGLIMLWSPNVYVLLLAWLLDGFGVGLAVTLVPLYISETAEYPSSFCWNCWDVVGILYDFRDVIDAFPELEQREDAGGQTSFAETAMSPSLKMKMKSGMKREGEGYASEGGGVESDSNLQSPLISRQTTTMEKGFIPPHSHGSILQGNSGTVGSTGIGSGWPYLHGVCLVLRHQWGSVLHSSNPRASRGRRSPLRPWYQLRLLDIPHQRADKLIDASEYWCCSEAHECCRKKVPSLFLHCQCFSNSRSELFSCSCTLRSLLLTTIPILITSLVALVIGNVFDFEDMAHAVISTVCVSLWTLYCHMCPCFLDIVTYMLPVMLGSIGLAGAFGIYASICTISWFFVFLRVSETKGMPLKVITDFFAVGAKIE
ncbi:hypothetical protein SASPL_133769 [Salvia splendens]|uniref:Uncharacterized protein n=1 Tax=Salvia splendens TaxID=180675 RepID=A0A8X8X1X6_SALSN|nr:hypothetical protein SASPL_133769 [Salvia splendens]